MYQLPSPRMKETYRFFVDAGADAVINHHQHCYSGYEVYNSKPIFYGLGNFCFDRINKCVPLWNEGFMVTLTMNEFAIDFELIPYIQGNDETGVRIIEDKDVFSKNISCLNEIISDNTKLKIEFKSFMDRTSKGYLLALEPYQNRYMKALYCKGLLPSFLTKDRLLMLANYLKCEAHIERLINSLKHNYLC